MLGNGGFLITLSMPSPIFLLPFSATISSKQPLSGISISAYFSPLNFVAYIFHKKQRKDIILVLRGVHPAL
jgi:hypothetical protein